MAQIVLDQVAKSYGEGAALHATDLTVPEGEFLTLLGPSGCGKTTTLRIVAGFAQPTGGRLLMDGQDVTHLPPQKRSIGMVFQDYALFPHMTVEQNIAFGLRERGVGAKHARERVAELLDLIQLVGLEGRYPAQLSGGQQQRVALARAIAHPPRVLLLDEPFAALDRKLREQMQLELRQVQRSLGITTIFVTHDRTEAMNLSDTIAVMSAGRVVQRDTPEAVYSRPRSLFVADLLGQINLLEGRVGGVAEGHLLFEGAGFSVRIPATGVSTAGLLGVRPENVVLVQGPRPEGLNVIAATIVSSVYHGNLWRVTVAVGAREWIVETRTDQPLPAVGETVSLGWKPEHGILFAK